MKNVFMRGSKVIGLALIFIMIFAIPAFADGTNYGENFGRWFLDQIFWVGAIALAVVLIKLFIARDYTKMVISLIVGGVVLFIIKYPDKIQSVGQSIYNIIFGG